MERGLRGEVPICGVGFARRWWRFAAEVEEQGGVGRLSFLLQTDDAHYRRGGR